MPVQLDKLAGELAIEPVRENEDAYSTQLTVARLALREYLVLLASAPIFCEQPGALHARHTTPPAP